MNGKIKNTLIIYWRTEKPGMLHSMGLQSIKQTWLFDWKGQQQSFIYLMFRKKENNESMNVTDLLGLPKSLLGFFCKIL